MFRSTELVSNDSKEVRDKFGINEEIRDKVRDKFGINEEEQDKVQDKFEINSDICYKFGEHAAKIVNLMCENQEITLDEIAEVIGVTRRTVEKKVKLLKEAGIVTRVGSNKRGVWKVTEKD